MNGIKKLCFLLTGILHLIGLQETRAQGSNFILTPGVFTALPVNLADLKLVIPLGNLNPPGHTLPTPHLYLNVNDATKQYSVFSPGNITLTGVKKYVHGGTAEDYSLEMQVGGDYYLYFHHIIGLEPDLLAKIGAINSNCQSYTIGETVHSFCEKTLALPLKAGQLLGKIGGGTAISKGLDMGLYKRLPTDQIETLCPIDYFTADLKAKLEAKLGGYAGKPRIPVPPVCGTVYQDIPGKLQGVWFLSGKPKYPEDLHIAFVHDNVFRNVPAISVGKSQKGLESGVYTFPLQISRPVNRDFNIQAPGAVWCFDQLSRVNGGPAGSIGADKSIIVEFLTPDKIRVEYRPSCNCSCQPGSFTANAVTYDRGKM